MTRPIPAIIEPAPIDTITIAEQIIAALADHRGIETKITRLEGQLGDARGAARMRRIEIGRLLLRARGAWPTRGPNAKGWSEFCAKVKLADSTARMYMDECRDPAAFADKRAKTPEDDQSDDDDQTGPRIVPDPDRPREAAPFRAMTADDIVQALARLPAEERKRVLREGKANVAGGSGEVTRGTWCTPKALAIAVGPWDLDPFSNPRSHVAAARRCMLEDGGDGFAGGDGGGMYGMYRVRTRDTEYAESATRVWIQPPYELVLDAIDHYKHTRFGALLRWAPDTKWFAHLWPLVQAVAFPRGERLEFEPPEGIEASSNPYPHALYYADERDVTDEVRAMCIVWRVDHSSDPATVTPIDETTNTTKETA